MKKIKFILFFSFCLSSGIVFCSFFDSVIDFCEKNVPCFGKCQKFWEEKIYKAEEKNEYKFKELVKDWCKELQQKNIENFSTTLVLHPIKGNIFIEKNFAKKMTNYLKISGYSSEKQSFALNEYESWLNKIK